MHFLILTCSAQISGGFRGLRGDDRRVTGLVGDDGLDDNLGLVGARLDVGVGDRQLSGYEGSTLVSKVPVECGVGITQVLAGVVQSNGESDGAVLDEAQVPCYNVVHLVQ